MKYDDLLSVPFKYGGRGMDGMDCYGLVAECCRRAGTPINDPFRELDSSIPLEEALRIRQEKIAAREADGPARGRVLCCFMGGRTHVGYMLSRDRVLHAVEGGCPRVSPLLAFRNPVFFEPLPMEGDRGNSC